MVDPSEGGAHVMGAWEGGVCYPVLCAYYMLSTVSAHRAISNTQPGSGYVFSLWEYINW